MPTRYERVAAAIDSAIASGDVQSLILMIEYGPCGCLGRVDGEPQCRCVMTEHQVRGRVSYAALKRGQITLIKN